MKAKVNVLAKPHLYIFSTLNHYDHTSFRLHSLNDLCYDPPCCLGYKTINTTSHDLLMNSDESVVNHITKPFIVLLFLFFFMACPFNRVSCCSSREARESVNNFGKPRPAGTARFEHVFEEGRGMPCMYVFQKPKRKLL